MRLTVFGIAFLVALLLVSGCIQKNTKIQDNETPNTPEFPGKLHATVSVSNTAPAVGESVSFSYNIVYEGTPTKVVIIQKKSWPDTSNNKFEKKVSEIDNGATSIGLSTASFNETGEYTFELGIFDCKEVEAKLNTTCENAGSENIFSKVLPIEIAKRTVNVAGMPEPQDCGTSQICLLEKIETCAPTTATIKVFEETKITVQGFENGKCKVHYLTLRSPNPALEGLEFTCLVPTDRLSDYEQFLAESGTTACTGPYWDYLQNANQDVEDNGETGASDFLSEQSCVSHSDCPVDYPACFLRQKCAKPVQSLSGYIQQNYEQGNCQNIPCENCLSGALVPQTIVYSEGGYSFDESFCVECTSTYFKCNAGYVCSLGKCVQG